MPAPTPDESGVVAKRIGVAVLGLLVGVIGVYAGIAVWTLLSGQSLGVGGWIYIICFVFAAIGFVPMARQVLRPPPEK